MSVKISGRLRWACAACDRAHDRRVIVAVAVIVTVRVIVRAVRMPVVPVGVFVDRELGRRHAGPQDTLGMDVHVAEPQRPQGALQVVERQAGIEHRAECHVARDSREAIEVEHPAHSVLVSLASFMLQYRESPRIR